MSCIIGLLSKLGIVNVEILKKALEVTAKEKGVLVGKSVQDFHGTYTSWQGMEIIGSLTTADVPRGIGVAIDKEGKLHFVGYSHGCQTAFNEFQQRIEVNYKTITAILACQALGYQVRVTEKDGVTVLEGEKQ